MPKRLHPRFANQVRTDLFDGILVPGGFGTQGIKGMENAVNFSQQYSIPYFGICLGMQVMITGIMNSRNSNMYYCSAEWEEPKYAVHKVIIDLLPEQDQKLLGGTMRLGNYETTLVTDSQAMKIYGGSKKIVERHRHRYEVTKDEEVLEGLIRFTGFHEETGLPEIAEGTGVTKHFMIGCQFHPEYRSRFWNPHPLFVAFVCEMMQ